jgi:hypothetical protein
MCYFVFGSQGACVELCSGSPDSPSCSGGSVCRIDNDGFLPLCLPRCDPLQQDCPEHATCLVDEDARVFTCLVDASVDGGHVNQPCTHVNGCKPGLFCAPSDLLPQCDGDPGCCTNYCDVTAQSPDDACQVADTQCLQWFREPPAEYDHVGGCIQPIIP